MKWKRSSGSVNVVADGQEMNTTDAATATSFKQETLQSLPLVNERFQDALPLVPGVVRGPDGLLNMKGARANQSALTVNSANVTDPVTGEGAINLPLEAIQSVEVVTNPYAPEYGQFTGAVTTVQTKSGGEKFTRKHPKPCSQVTSSRWSLCRHRSFYSAGHLQWSSYQGQAEVYAVIRIPLYPHTCR